MPEPLVTGEARRKILAGAAIYGVFFGLMPPYVLTIVVMATWGVGQLEAPDEQTFRSVYYVRLVLGNLIGLLAGGFLCAGAVDLVLRLAGKVTYVRGVLGGLLLGPPVGALTASSTAVFLLVSSTDTAWAWEMVRRSFICGGMMGLTNGVVAGVVIVYFLKSAAQQAP